MVIPHCPVNCLFDDKLWPTTKISISFDRVDTFGTLNYMEINIDSYTAPTNFANLNVEC